MTKEKHENIAQEHADIAFEFLEKLFGDDVEAYWKTISKVDQSRVYGMYRAYVELTNTNETFLDYVKNNFQKEQQKIFQNVKGNSGIATHLRYTDEGEILLYMLEDVQVPRVYIAETQVLTYPIVVTLDSTINNGEVLLEWKVRLYRDLDYMKLI